MASLCALKYKRLVNLVLSQPEVPSDSAVVGCQPLFTARRTLWNQERSIAAACPAAARRPVGRCAPVVRKGLPRPQPGQSLQRTPLKTGIGTAGRPRLTWWGPSDRASAGRATPRGSPGPSWKQSLLPARCGQERLHREPRRQRQRVEPSSPAGSFRLLAGLSLCAGAGARSFAPCRLRFAARIRTLAPSPGGFPFLKNILQQ